MRALITGGHGFVGKHLHAHLVESGDDVAVLDRTDGFDVTDADGTRRAIEQAQPEVVYHLAAMAHVGESWGSPALVFRVNAEGTFNVLEAARACGVRRVLVVGSAEEYGRVERGDASIREDNPLRPASPYGVSKVAAGLIAQQAFLAHGDATIHVRPFNHTGAGQAPTFVAPAFARRIVEAERSGADHIAVGNLEPVRELLDVRDVVRAYRLLIERGQPGEVYNVARGRGFSVREIAETLLSFAKATIRLEVDPELVRPVDVPRLVGDPAKLTNATGWSPRYELADTLEWVFDDARTATANLE
jgi:GDP-4-dehydro-6-deoxy-D-mannose reductase